MGLPASPAPTQVNAQEPTPASDLAIRIRGLKKNYGAIEAVRGIDLDVRRGEIFAFLGPNGAGKSTTIKMLCTLTDPTAGEATVAGFDIQTQRNEVRRHIGLVFQDPTVDGYLTAEQNLRFHGELYGVDRSTAAARREEVLRMVGLLDRRDSLVNGFSGGMRRRLEIARGLLHSPRVLFLDEPTVGLDPQTRASIWEYIRQLRETEGVTVFVTTHYMEEAENCDRIAIMNNGLLVALGTPQGLKGEIGKDRVQISTDDNQAAIVSLKERMDQEASVHEGLVTISVANGAAFVPRLFSELPIPIRSVTVRTPSLDDVFLAHTGTTIREADESGTARSMAAMFARRR